MKRALLTQQLINMHTVLLLCSCVLVVVHSGGVPTCNFTGFITQYGTQYYCAAGFWNPQSASPIVLNVTGGLLPGSYVFSYGLTISSGGILTLQNVRLFGTISILFGATLVADDSCYIGDNFNNVGTLQILSSPIQVACSTFSGPILISDSIIQQLESGTTLTSTSNSQTLMLAGCALDEVVVQSNVQPINPSSLQSCQQLSLSSTATGASSALVMLTLNDNCKRSGFIAIIVFAVIVPIIVVVAIVIYKFRYVLFPQLLSKYTPEESSQNI